MNILRVIVDELPEYCQLCTYHKGETYSFVANVCTLIDKVVEVEQLFEKSYPDWCPLEIKKDTNCGKLKDALEADLHALYAVQDLMMEHPIIRGHATTMTIINASITRASKLLKESES